MTPGVPPWPLCGAGCRARREAESPATSSLLKTTLLPRRDHQIQVLHGGAGGSFAEIVEYRSQQNLTRLVVYTHDQAQIIRPVQRLWVKVRQLFGSLHRQHVYVIGVAV